LANDDNTLVEYLYIDEARLDRYFEQISSPVAYDKVPIWKAALGLAGPKAEATQARPGRPFTTHEKVAEFVKHLEKHKLTLPHRPRDPSDLIALDMSQEDEKPYRSERMTARRCHIAAKKDDSGSQSLNIWVSLEPDEPQSEDFAPIGALFLIEDFRGDEGVLNFISGYSSLLQLTEELHWDIEVTDLDLFSKQDEAEKRFGTDPIGTLAAVGARFGPSRRIHAVYRIRACGFDVSGITTIGYPIVIQAL
jgi:hypothetical protein